jgi:predicted dehydrogenase
MNGISVCGVGDRMRGLLRLLLNEYPKSRILEIYDPDPSQIEKFKKEVLGDVSVANSFNESLKKDEIDWIFIGSPNYAHKDQIISALNNDKNVFSEKPIAISLEECEEIKKKFEEKNLKFLISYPLRYSLFYKRVKDIVDSGDIGEIISLEFNETLEFHHGSFIMANWRRFEEYSGGHLLEKCCHDFDIVNWIIDDLPIKVSSFGGLNFFNEKNKNYFQEFNHLIKGKKNPFTSKKNIVDNQVVILEFNRGAKVSFHTNCSSSLPERRMYICGTKGTIKADVLSGLVQWKILGSSEKRTVIDEKNKGGHGNGDVPLIKDIVDGMEGKESSVSNPLYEALISSITTISADEARKKEKIINLLPYWKKLGYIKEHD